MFDLGFGLIISDYHSTDAVAVAVDRKTRLCIYSYSGIPRLCVSDPGCLCFLDWLAG